ncbi:MULTISPECIES: DUF4177 domain-containing protein [unclassified Paracoccus (in: a-proteobacteria)]|uniref:DUF4177 domain-containing protein n=1 Tax=unclassified Paracoccus (in: a-proteobacteria) TaxID=2688777 RepID=UPI0021E12363|nr:MULTISPECIES: DUF4177 domain-containing protein [unclassified Paracoccus (in: a-proteobacteria)]UXU73963.1 DUF4177 domain-containing protein [Paracoccus sp. SMMA_5]UXU79850.1 DUF4177 domain-containing protein [Paracoccus sp. SMMA_5_TC]
MSSYEYTVIPAPARGEKLRGARSGIERFAATLAETLNAMAGDGWEYLRAETLPAEERSGLTGRTTVYHNLLIFRRRLPGDDDRAGHERPQAQPVTPPVTPPAQASQSQPEPQQQDAPASQPAQSAAPTVLGGPGRMPFSQPMRPVANTAPGRGVEPPLTRPQAPAAPAGPRLGPANR